MADIELLWPRGYVVVAIVAVFLAWVIFAPESKSKGKPQPRKRQGD